MVVRLHYSIQTGCLKGDEDRVCASADDTIPTEEDVSRQAASTSSETSTNRSADTDSPALAHTSLTEGDGFYDSMTAVIKAGSPLDFI